MGVVRGMALFGGAAVTIALVLGAASVALAANGQPWLLGKFSNTATNTTALVAEVANPDNSALQVRNMGARSALDLRVGSGPPADKTVPPMRVNSQANVANLNADQLDGQSAEGLGVNGYEQVVAQSANDSESPKRVFADCPEGKVAVDAGYLALGPRTGNPPNQYLNATVGQASETYAVVQAWEITPTEDRWTLFAVADCVNGRAPE